LVKLLKRNWASNLNKRKRKRLEVCKGFIELRVRLIKQIELRINTITTSGFSTNKDTL